MTSESSILIVSTKVDRATEAVVEQLSKRSVGFHRLNTEDFPFQDTLVSVPVNVTSQDVWLLHNGNPLRNELPLGDLESARLEPLRLSGPDTETVRCPRHHSR